jgi:hypothetical protein
MSSQGGYKQMGTVEPEPQAADNSGPTPGHQ